MGYIQFLWEGRGLVKRGASVYLSTGSYTHIGLEQIFKWCKNNNNENPHDEIVNMACALATSKYREEIKERGFDLEDGEDRTNEKYVVEEQCALVEAFIRSFCFVVLPDLLAQYRVVDVEREEEHEEGNLVIQGRIDVILEELTTGHIYIISFKTSAGWDRRQEKANEHDNQGLSETYLLEKRLANQNEYIDLVSNNLQPTEERTSKEVIKATQKYLEYINKFRKNDKVMGVLMIYFLKGKRYETSEGSGRWEQKSPLIRAYRKLVGVEYEYSGSLYYPKPENKSGWGRLGKGWEDFPVWEEEGGVKEWIRKLASDEIQGGRELLAKQFKIPTAYFRKEEHLQSWYRQTRAIESDIKRKNDFIQSRGVVQVISFREQLDISFPQRRRNCHYPNDCQYVGICYTDGIFDDPIGSGKYMWRIPHHEAEAREHEKLYSISAVQVQTDRVSKNDEVLSDDDVIEEVRSIQTEEEEEVIIDE
jgi:hypothetical protein